VKIFDHRIGQYFTSNPFDFGLGLFSGEAAVDRKFEIFALPHALQSFVAHLFQRTLDGLTLGVKDAFLERDVDVCRHGELHYTSDIGKLSLFPLLSTPESLVTGV